ncbi:MAG: type II toxin-antitoxin system RelE/ParE family toxin [Oscillospiraceae bacterium]|nr:type II toxin-antitoxin system RelE/ParE family toxin [Oscillospiraceae bacterium]
MDTFEVIISPEAKSQLSDYVRYIRKVLLNDVAAKSVYEDAIETGKRLSVVAGSLAYCKDEKLRNYGYRAIYFKRHQYVMIYRTVGQIAYVDGIFHLRQDYENLFAINQDL